MAGIRKYSESRIGNPIGLDFWAGRERIDRMVRNQVQDDRRRERIGRRAYRDALRNNDMGAAMKALDWTGQNGGSVGGMSSLTDARADAQKRMESRLALFNSPNALMPAAEENVASTLNDRIGLFRRMVDSNLSGGDPNNIAFRQEARSLGIDEQGFAQGLSRATSNQPPQQPTSFNQPSPRSPVSQNGGLAAFVLNDPANPFKRRFFDR